LREVNTHLGIDFSLVRYFTILGFSDGGIVAIRSL
jgi:hypothetical protein